MEPGPRQRKQAPANHDHDHHGGDLHDPEGLLAGLVNSLDVLPPEIHRDHHAECSGKCVHRDMNRVAKPRAQVLHEAGHVLSGGNGADGAGKNVVEQQRGDGELGQGPAHGFFHHAVDAAAYEHAAGFNIDSAHGVAEEHHSQNKPRRAFADHVFRVAANVVSRRRQVGENNRRGAPERNKRQHDGCRHKNRDGRTTEFFQGCIHRACFHRPT